MITLVVYLKEVFLGWAKTERPEVSQSVSRSICADDGQMGTIQVPVVTLMKSQ